MPRALFRVDASDRIGTGHLARCLVLAQALRAQGFDCAFAACAHADQRLARVEAAGFNLISWPPRAPDVERGEGDPAHAGWLGARWQDDAARTRAAILAFGGRVDWMVVDHYALDARWHSSLRDLAGAILVVDDLADREHDADLLLDQNLVAGMHRRYRGRVGADTVRLLGPAYALLQEEYAQLHLAVSPRRGAVKRLLLNFGGADPAQVGARALSAFLRLDPAQVEVDVIAPAAQAPGLRALAGAHPRVRVHDPLPSMAPLLAETDLALGAAGVSSWERLCLGVPALVLALADNQLPIAEELGRRGLARYLGREAQVDEAAIAAALADALASGCNETASRRGLELVDGRGAARVVAAMVAPAASSLRARRAGAADEGLLLEWANDPGTRSGAFNPEPIAPATHHAWLQARLSDPEACRLLIIDDADGVALGTVRLQREGAEWEVHFALAPAARGRGLGRALVQAGLRELGAATIVFGQVKAGNTASRRIFEALGFEEADAMRAGTILYRRPL